MLSDPMILAVAECRRAFHEYSTVLSRDPEGDQPESISAGNAYRAAYDAALDTRPTTLTGVAALAGLAVDLGNDLGADEPLHETLEVLSRLDQT